LRRSLR